MKIAMLLEQGATASSVTTTLDMFRLAQRYQPEAGWQPQLYSAAGGLLRLNDAVAVETQRLPADLGDFDAIILPGHFCASGSGIVEWLACHNDLVARP
jgi:transcriptional regulator GlxA family with amidase domain